MLCVPTGTRTRTYTRTNITVRSACRRNIPSADRKGVEAGGDCRGAKGGGTAGMGSEGDERRVGGRLHREVRRRLQWEVGWELRDA